MNRLISAMALLIVFYGQLTATDLTVSNPVLNSTSVEAGNTISVNFRLNNIGNIPSGSSYTGFYLSTDNVYDAGDVYLTSKFDEGLAASSNLTTTDQILTIPQNTLVGTYYLILYADYDQDVVEINELNNTISLSLTISPSQAKDLTMTITSNTLTVEQGNYLSLDLTVSNIEAGDIGPSFVGLYLSSNTAYDVTDISVSTNVYVSSLAGNSNITVYGNGNIPLNTPPGTYYLIARADNMGQILETDETNNSAYITITVVTSANARDLSVSNLSFVPGIETGDDLQINCRINNTGTSTVGYSKTGYYLSSDQTLDGTDLLLDYRTVYYVYNNSWSDEHAAIRIPVTIATGNYYLLVKADYDLQVVETNESNNVAFAAISITNPSRDLTAFNPTLSSASVEQYSKVTIGYTLKNLGSGSFPQSITRAYLSADLVIDGQDKILLTYNNPLPLAATNYGFSYQVSIPSNVSPGNYYVIIKGDAPDYFIETNKTNNICSIAITITPYTNNVDLSLTSPGVWSNITTIEAGDLTYPNYYLSNLGTSTITTYTSLGIYLSTDNTLSGGDILLGTTQVNPMGGGDGPFYYAAQVRIPSATVPGNYYLIYHADDLSDLSEVSETNNFGSVAITVQAPADRDLTVTNPSISGLVVSIEAGVGFVATATVNNIGTSPVTFSGVDDPALGIYLSSDNIFDANDFYLGFQYISALGAGSSEVLDTYIDLYQGTPAGSYYLLFVADYYDNRVLESNENNNVAVLPLAITAPNIDLTVSSIFPNVNSVEAGDTIELDLTFNNSGSSHCNYFEADVYLSTNTTLGPTDVLLYVGLAIPEILPGSSFDFINQQIVIPDYIATGNYYIIVDADPYNDIFETNDNNNNNNVPIYVTGTPHPDLVVVHPTISSTTIAADSYVNVSYYVKNTGDSTAATCLSNIAVSEDQIFDVSWMGIDYIVSSGIVIPELEPGDSVLIEQMLYLQSLQERSYYLLLNADQDNIVIESAELNNYAALAFDYVYNGALDFVPESALFNPEMAEANGTVDMDYVIRNAGNRSFHTSPYNVDVMIYYSEDATFDSGTDVFLDYGTLYSIVPAGASATLQADDLLIPADAQEGQRYIIIRVDEADGVIESDETNNMLIVPLMIVPTGSLDLRISAASLNASILPPGTDGALNFTLKNSGLGIINQSSVGIYLSNDNSWDASDNLLSSYDQPAAFGAGESFTETSYTLDLPTLAEGNYFIILKADNAEEVSEYFENNNTTVVPFVVGYPLAVEKENSLASVVYYPNPAKELVNVKLGSQLPETENTFIVVNNLGEKVIEKNITSTEFQFNVSSLVPGVYTCFIKGETGLGKLVVIK